MRNSGAGMRILLFGKNGQIGWQLHRSLMMHGTIAAYDYPDIDFAKPLTLRSLVRSLRPDVIVNAAAFTSVEKAESNARKAMLINATSVAVLAEEAERHRALLVHYSSEDVFNGEKRSAYTEDDQPNPLNVYGESKLAGDRAILESNCRYLIFRTAWLYATRGNNFLVGMLKLARDHRSIQVVKDQIGAPTWVKMVAQATALALYKVTTNQGARIPSGIYNLSAAGETSWFNFAEAFFAAASAAGICAMPTLEPILSEDYPGAVQRPLNSLLSCDKLHATFDIHTPAWQDALPLVLQELVPLYTRNQPKR